MKGLAQASAWWLLILVMLIGCGGPQATSHHHAESLEQTTAQALAYDGDYNDSCFSDDLVDLSLRITDEDTTAFQLTLTNKTGAPLRVLWDKAVFLDASGNAQHMIHQGVDYGQALDALVPARLAVQATLNDLLRPAKAVLDGDLWRLAPLTGRRDTSNYLDQRLRIDLPLEINGQVNLYRFRFHVESSASSQAVKEGGRDSGP